MLATSTYCNGRWLSRRNTWYTTLENCHHKNQLMLGQPALERVLAKHAIAHGVDLHYGETATAISETPAAGVVTVTTDKGETITAAYAVGADGSRSMVRRSAAGEISFTGEKPGMIWAVLDAFIETDFPRCPEVISFEWQGQARVQWIPRERGLARFYAMLEGEVTREKAMECIKEHLAPHWIEFKAVEWFSTVQGK